jgi:hypothetical protein
MDFAPPRWHRGALVVRRGAATGSPVTGVAAVVAVVLALGGCSAAPAAVPRTADEAMLTKIFAGLGEGPFDPGGAPTVDGRRVLDVLTAQGALVRHRAARGTYPATLDELVPGLLAAAPRDPVTEKPYRYERLAGGADYALAATLSNGQVFAGVPVGER